MSHRRMTPKGQMSSNGSGPAIMMMKPHIRATFMPDPPLRHLAPPKKGGSSRRPNHSGKVKAVHPNSNPNDEPKPNDSFPTSSLTGLSSFLIHFERSKPLKRTFGSTPVSARQTKHEQREKINTDKLASYIDQYQQHQENCKGEYDGMNCYNTLFVGRLAYETTERKLLRELESFGPVKDLKLVMKKHTLTGNANANVPMEKSSSSSSLEKSRGYAFVEFENMDDMKRAYRAADGMRLDGKEIVVDVERGHTVLNWLPRRLGGGLGGTRLGGRDKNITVPGRFDPTKQRPSSQPPPHNAPPHYHPNHHPPPHPHNSHARHLPPPNHHPPPHRSYPPHRSGGPPFRGSGGGPPPSGRGGPYGGPPGPPYGNRGGGPPPPWERDRRREGPDRDRERDRDRDRGGRNRYGPGNGPPPSGRGGGHSYGGDRGDRDKHRDRDRDRDRDRGRYGKRTSERSDSPPSSRRRVR